MSGRLTILPKKTYCPWKPENIERVLRDERLERERIEKESSDVAKHKQQQRLQHDRSRRDGNGDDIKSSDIEESSKERGHINLFPEAKQAELQLTHTTSLSNQQQHTNNNGKLDESGVAPIPLGGNESINRKVGNVPFYMRSSTTATSTSAIGSSTGTTTSTNNEEKYINTNNSFRLGTKRSTKNNYTNNNNTDAITTKIMQDQYIQREDYRKRNMDPMNRFYADVKPSTTIRSKGVGGTGRMEGVYANGSANGSTSRSGLVDSNRGDTSSKPRGNNDKKRRSSVDEDKKHKKKKKKRRKRSYSSSDSSTTSSSVDRHKKKRKHKSKKKKHSSSHRDHHHHRHNNSKSDNKTELEELRRRRHAREVNEHERLSNSRGDASSSFDGSTMQSKDTRCYDGSNGFH